MTFIIAFILGIITAPFYMVIEGSKQDRRRSRNKRR